MEEILVDKDLTAFCGLYCGACRRYLKGGCPGCDGYENATWCNVRKCCLEREYSSCADCSDFDDPGECGKFNSFLSRVVGFVLRSDRRACIKQIKEVGPEEHAQKMAELGRPALKP